MTTQATEQRTCANCPFFKDYGEYRGQGLCHLSGKVTRRRWRKVSDCYLAIVALKREYQLKDSDVAYAVMAELISREEEEQDGYPVPVETVDLLLTVPRLETTAVIAAAKRSLRRWHRKKV